MHDELIKELEAIGLSEKEARVYLAVLEVGQATVQEIGKKADVNRATTYVILDSLMTKGLIATFGEGKKSLYIAEAPHGLNNIIREQEEELEKRNTQLDILMPELHSLYNLHPNKPDVKFYEGKEGLQKMLDERLVDSPDEVAVFFPVQDVYEVFSKEDIERYRKRRIKADTTYYGVCSTGDTEDSAKFEKGELLKVPMDKYPFYSDIAVYDDKVSLSSLKGHISGVIIENKLVANTLRSIFSLVFEYLKDQPKK